MKWFGPPWRAPVNVAMERTSVPVGEPCLKCGEPIKENEQGYMIPALHETADGFIDEPWHRVCFMKSLGLA